MNKYIKILLGCVALAGTACQNNDIDIQPAKIAPIDANAISAELVGNDYILSWPATDANLDVIVTVYQGDSFLSSERVETNSYTHKDIDTNIEYTYVIRLTDGENQSNGVVRKYLRPGASKMAGLALAQVENGNLYDMSISWDANPTATAIEMTASNGARTINETLAGATTSYTISDVKVEEVWNVQLVAKNNDGSSLPVNASLRIGKTAVGYLSVYPTEADLMANGDDDEICAWLWMKETYPTSKYVYFGEISAASYLDNYRVLFWIRDLEGVDASAVFEYPACVEEATPAIKQWYANGGNLLLWSHATAYVGKLGRVDTDLLKAANSINTGEGGYNGDTWRMAVSLNPGSAFTCDNSYHPIYRGLTVENGDRCKLIAFKGPGWTEDHNCLYFDIPTALTGLGNQDQQCYMQLTDIYGIYPLGTWDSQIDWVSQLNVWEAQQGNTEFKGTVLCIGNGGCEFSLKNDDGTPDISAHPKNNIYQDNVLKLAQNSIEYLKTR